MPQPGFVPVNEVFAKTDEQAVPLVKCVARFALIEFYLHVEFFAIVDRLKHRTHVSAGPHPLILGLLAITRGSLHDRGYHEQAPCSTTIADTIRMTPEAAGELAVSALKRVGFTGEDARIIADQLVDNALCGYRFASLPRILAIAGNNKTQNERRPIQVVHETPLSALIDGGNNLGYVSVYNATEVAINKARDRGFAMERYDSYYSGRARISWK